MKFTAVLFAALCASASVVVASPVNVVVPRETNADRLSRGLPPLSPIRRTPTAVTPATYPKPSGYYQPPTPQQIEKEIWDLAQQISKETHQDIRTVLKGLGIKL